LRNDVVTFLGRIEEGVITFAAFQARLTGKHNNGRRLQAEEGDVNAE
jgi:hypothetical protein